jgi:RecB family exonuclease
LTVRTISWSEIDSWRQCPFKWRLEYAERWVPAETSPALSKGTLWHTVLEKHYRILQSSRSLATAMDAVDAFLDAMTTDTSVYGSATPPDHRDRTQARAAAD